MTTGGDVGYRSYLDGPMDKEMTSKRGETFGLDAINKKQNKIFACICTRCWRWKQSITWLD